MDPSNAYLFDFGPKSPTFDTPPHRYGFPSDADCFETQATLNTHRFPHHLRQTMPIQVFRCLQSLVSAILSDLSAFDEPAIRRRVQNIRFWPIPSHVLSNQIVPQSQRKQLLAVFQRVASRCGIESHDIHHHPFSADRRKHIDVFIG